MIINQFYNSLFFKMNKDLSQIQTFVEVAKYCSFSIAAEKLGIEKSTASVKVKLLEQTLGVTLLYRTTRKVSLTEAGHSYYELCLKALAALTDANDYIQALGNEPQGKLRIGTPHNMPRVLLEDMLPKYLAENPKVDVDIVQSNRFEDITEGHFDILIRSNKSEVPDSTLIYRKLFETKWVIVANLSKLNVSPPSSIAELLSLPYVGCLNETSNSVELQHKTLNVAGVNHELKPRFSVNNMEHTLQAVAKGIGFTIAPIGMVSSAIQAGEMELIMPEIELPITSLYAVYLSRRGQPAKVSSFINALFDWRDSRFSN